MFQIFKLRKRRFANRTDNRPKKSFTVDGTSISVGVWDSGRQPLGEKYRFKLSRISESGRRYSALQAKDIFVLPSVALKLAQVFLESTDDVETKKELVHFIALVSDYEKVRKASMGQAIFNGAATSDCGQTFGC
jgi:hypothetical protein